MSLSMQDVQFLIDRTLEQWERGHGLISRTPTPVVVEEPPPRVAPSPSAPPVPAEPSSADALWTADDVAGFLRKSTSWVRQAKAAGRLPFLTGGVLGSSIRFDPDVIRAFARGEEPANKVLTMPQRKKEK